MSRTWIGSTARTSSRSQRWLCATFCRIGRAPADCRKSGGKTPRVNLDEIPDIASRSASELVALDDTFNALAKIDPRKASRACSVD
jgi:hypothetical protein